MTSDQSTVDPGASTNPGTEPPSSELADNAERVPSESADGDVLNAQMREHPAAQPPDQSHA